MSERSKVHLLQLAGCSGHPMLRRPMSWAVEAMRQDRKDPLCGSLDIAEVLGATLYGLYVCMCLPAIDKKALIS
jgi:hypothetical protein